jgi:predicted DNA binding CopG/RHH family protein
VRLQKELVEQLKVMAKKEGLGYQPFIRHILTRYVRDTVSAESKRESA